MSEIGFEKVGPNAVRVKRLKKIGSKGGQRTARKYGRNHFAKLAAKRKHCRGGRPRKGSWPVVTRG